jgi:hypothetical protein
MMILSMSFLRYGFQLPTISRGSRPGEDGLHRNQRLRQHYGPAAPRWDREPVSSKCPNHDFSRSSETEE